MKNVTILIMLLMVIQSRAENVIIKDTDEEMLGAINIVGNAQIDFQTGDILVTTDENIMIVEQNEPVILGFYPNDYDVESGSNITVNWDVAFATSCNATTISGSSSWGGSKNSANGAYSEPNVSVSLPSTLRLTCDNAAGQSVSKTFVVTEQETGSGGGSNPAINSFTVGGQSTNAVVNPPGDVTVAWQTTDLNSCVASANPAVSGWSGTKPVDGNQTITFTESTIITLTCDGNVSRNVSVSYNENSSCSNSIYPPGLARVNATYASVNNTGAGFGVNANSEIIASFNVNTFLAVSGVQLTAPNSRIRIDYEDAPGGFNENETSSVSLSECPGDFTETAVCVDNLVRRGQNTLFSNRASDIGNPNICYLDPTKTYYLNFAHTPTPSVAGSSQCKNVEDEACAVFYAEGVW